MLAEQPKAQGEPSKKDARGFAGDTAGFLEDDEQPAAEAGSAGIVVIPSLIGGDNTAEGKRIAKEFAGLIGMRLPLISTPSLDKLRPKLLAEFPYAASVVGAVLLDLFGKKYVRLRPTILVGPPGCGKTRFSKKLAEWLAPYDLISCGGMNDATIGGTARHWSTGGPSLPVAAVRRHKTANLIIILDEIEKIATSRHNGNVHDVLLGLFERETSSRWYDPYVQAGCDLSQVSWLMTANEVGSIPAVLRDRCRIIPFPEPGAEQLPNLATRLLEDLYLERGQDRRWATALEGFELEALRVNWPGGSIRKLQRLVERVVDVRERCHENH